MNEPIRHPGAHRSWIRALGPEIVVCLLTASLLSIAVRFCFPEIEDDRYVSNIVGIEVWVVSIGAGALQAARYGPWQNAAKLRFSLRSLLIGTMLICVLLAVLVQSLRNASQGRSRVQCTTYQRDVPQPPER